SCDLDAFPTRRSSDLEMKKFFGSVLAVVVGNILTFSLIALVMGCMVLFTIAGEWFQPKGPKSGSVLEITFESPIKESSMDNEVRSEEHTSELQSRENL